MGDGEALAPATLASQRERTSSTAPSAPETTVEPGELIAAIESSTSRPSIDSAISASIASIAAIAPPDGNSPIRRPLAQISSAASSRLSTPAIWAAAISPTECPASRSGSRPRLSSALASATSSANRAGWA